MTALTAVREVKLWIDERRKTWVIDWERLESDIDALVLDAIVKRVHRDGFFTGDLNDYRYEWDGQVDLHRIWR